MRDIKRAQRFVLHQNVLENFSFELGNANASKLEDVESASLVQDSGADVVETFGVLEGHVGNVKLSQRPGVGQGPAYSFAIDLFIEHHMLERYLLQFAVLLDTFHDLLEIGEVLEGHPCETYSLQDGPLAQKVGQSRGCLLHDAGLLESEVDDTALGPWSCRFLVFLLAHQLVLDLLF